MDTFRLTREIRKKAYELGFDDVGFSKAGPLDPEAFRLEQWLRQGKHGEMSWMERNFDKRIDPRKLVPGARTVVSVIAGYRFDENRAYDLETTRPKIAKYALGRDYHKVFRSRLKELFAYTEQITDELQGRVFSDSAPVMDKAWAVRSGLGWMGKNGNLIHRKLGSWFLIGEMIINKDCIPDHPVTEHCGRCTDCLDACPTQAIPEPFVIDSRKCISYLTIEWKEKMPQEYHEALGPWMFGCDICQDVCPWNRKTENGHLTDLQPRHAVTHPDKPWSTITEEEFHTLFEGSAVRRTSYHQFVEKAQITERNLQQIHSSS